MTMRSKLRAGILPAGVALLLTSVALAGCFGPGDTADGHASPIVHDIRMWVEAQDWAVHPNVEAPVWAFCAEGPGVEPVHDGACGVPGPTIRVTKGDIIRLTFENTHTIPHTVHFHGWHPFATDMNGADIMGEAMLVQPGGTGTIEWVAEPAGTFIYHCHFQTPTHMEMGMYGAFIVEDPAESTPDKEFVAVLDEWSIHEDAAFVGNFPDYNFFTINGKSFPTTEPWYAEPGERVRLHMVNAGFEFHAMHLHGYTPDSYEGVAGPRFAVPTDVREIAPGQSVVLDLDAEREGIWLFHDHVVPRVTAASNGVGFGAYPRGMLTVLVVGEDYLDALVGVAPDLLAAAARDSLDPGAGHGDPGHDHGAAHGEDDIGSQGGSGADGVVVDMQGFVFDEEELVVPVGTTVTWVNKDPAAHTVTFDDGSVDSGDIAAGGRWSYTFTEEGAFPYHCIPHSGQGDDGTWKGMVGKVTVLAA